MWTMKEKDVIGSSCSLFHLLKSNSMGLKEIATFPCAFLFVTNLCLLHTGLNCVIIDTHSPTNKTYCTFKCYSALCGHRQYWIYWRTLLIYAKLTWFCGTVYKIFLTPFSLSYDHKNRHKINKIALYLTAQ